MNRQDLASSLLKSLSTNAVNERRYVEAGRQYWSTAVEELKQAKDLRNLNEETEQHYKKF